MKYSLISKPELRNFCLKIGQFLLKNKRVELESLENLNLFFAGDSLVLKHPLVLHCYSKNAKPDGTIVKLSEKIIFQPKDYFIKTFSQEDYFGEYYTNNEYRIGDNEEEGHIEDYLKDAFISIVAILQDDNGRLRISINDG